MERSKEIWTVALFFAVCGNRANPEKDPGPQPQLQVSKWCEAYDLFFTRLSSGRTRSSFRNTLKNARDMFDGHSDSGRSGWRESSPGRPPHKLGRCAKGVFHDWKTKDQNDLWKYVGQFLDDDSRDGT